MKSSTITPLHGHSLEIGQVVEIIRLNQAARTFVDLDHDLRPGNPPLAIQDFSKCRDANGGGLREVCDGLTGFVEILVKGHGLSLLPITGQSCNPFFTHAQNFFYS